MDVGRQARASVADWSLIVRTGYHTEGISVSARNWQNNNKAALKSELESPIVVAVFVIESGTSRHGWNSVIHVHVHVQVQVKA